jgi:hypothetical protein
MPVEQIDWIKFITDEAEARLQEQKLEMVEDKPEDTIPKLTGGAMNTCNSDTGQTWRRQC